MIEQAVRSQARYWMDRVHLRMHGPAPLSDASSLSASLSPHIFRHRDAYCDHVAQRAEEYAERKRLVHKLESAGGLVETEAFCVACQRPRRLRTVVSQPGQLPTAVANWREGLICPGCGLNSRTRAAVHLLLWAIAPGRAHRLYLTEQVTALFRWVKLRFPAAVGSEYLPESTGRAWASRFGIRHEDLTALSFPDSSFDAVVSLEVIEHIPNFLRAFSECARVLAPGGRLLLSVPFHGGPEHMVRASLRHDGSITHHHPPEYHGDPLSRSGCLCFHHFGWDILHLLKEAGFRQARASALWSRALGYLASEGDIILFVAVK